jgi:hypothetical protein
VDGVANDGGNIDLVAGANITITPDNAANTITIAAGGGGLTLPYAGSTSQAIAPGTAAFNITQTGTGNAGYFLNSNNGPVKTVVVDNTSTDVSSAALYAHAAAGNAFEAASAGAAATMDVQNSGTGSAISATATAASAISVSKGAAAAGTGITVSNWCPDAGIAVFNHGASHGIRVEQSGASYGMFISQTGNASGGRIEIPSGNNTTGDCLHLETSSTSVNSDALVADAAMGNAIDGSNVSATVPTAVFTNGATALTAPILQLTGSSSMYFRRNGNIETYGVMQADYFIATQNAGAVNSVGKNNIVHAWARVNGSSCAIIAGYGITSIIHSATGTYLIVLDEPFPSSSSFSAVATSWKATSNYSATISAYNSGNSFTVDTYNSTGTAADSDFMVIVMGNR